MFEGEKPKWQQEIEDLMQEQGGEFAEQERYLEIRRTFFDIMKSVPEVGVVPEDWKLFLSRVFGYILKRIPVNDAVVWAFQIGRLWQHWKEQKTEPE